MRPAQRFDFTISVWYKTGTGNALSDEPGKEIHCLSPR
jgi:hypothetical protein